MQEPHEKGAIAIIVAILFGFGIMTGAAALTIDVGRINADRRQLQNGSDAVAMAAAQTCALTGVCPSATDSALVDLANANAADGFTKIRRVNGTSPPICGQGGGLSACPSLPVASEGNLQECPPPNLPSINTKYVRAYAETENAAGGTILPYTFGAAIAGVDSGANQQTCSSVAWGPVGATVAPITVSYCEFAEETRRIDPVTGAVTEMYPPNPVGSLPGGYGGSGQPAWPAPAAQLPAAPVPGHEVIISLQGTAGSCPSWNTHDAPGGFGYIQTATTCNASPAINGWTQADTGNTLPTGCDMQPYFNTVIYLPVFDCTVKVTGSTPIPTAPPSPTDSCLGGAGSNTWYHIQGYAAFYLSGYTTSGAGGGLDKNHDRTQAVSPQAPCSGSDRCLSGWFLKGLVVDRPVAPPLSGPDLGQYAIQNVG